MSPQLNHYRHILSKLRRGVGSFPSSVKGKAPHKPLLLLTIIDVIAQGELTANFIPLEPTVVDTYADYWDVVMPTERNSRFFLPFFHMKSEGLWHLVPQPGQEEALESIGQISGWAQLRETVLGAKLDDDLYALLQNVETREALRIVILETYFDEHTIPFLLQHAEISAISHQYSRELLDHARYQVPAPSLEAPQPVRDQGFRRAIVTAYAHRCVLCGLRLLTHEGRTAATAAHIIPWSVSYNDDPRNGLCLCRLCHWTFDVGLTTITGEYRIKLSSQITSDGNLPGHISILGDRPIFEPTEDVFNPDKEALQWHRKEVFLR